MVINHNSQSRFDVGTSTKFKRIVDGLLNLVPQFLGIMPSKVIPHVGLILVKPHDQLCISQKRCLI